MDLLQLDRYGKGVNKFGSEPEQLTLFDGVPLIDFGLGETSRCEIVYCQARTGKLHYGTKRCDSCIEYYEERRTMISVGWVDNAKSPLF